MKSKDKYKVIGVMSGTSLDGLDLACCRLKREKGKWVFKIIDAQTISYPKKWRDALAGAHLLSSADLLALDADYGTFIGESSRKFMDHFQTGKIDFIASHGHTVFHQPERKFTLQIGNGNAIHAASGIPVVFDFRSLDVLLGGQGAPLVPVGDRLLFPKFDVCINLGGIANLSLEKDKERIAFDVCFVNMALNYLAEKTGMPFDRNGTLASRGTVNEKLLGDLHNIYKPMKNSRPSLAREGFETSLKPLLDNDDVALEDKMLTVCQSAAVAIAAAIAKTKGKKILVTGGGTLNPVLMNLIGLQLKGAKITIPKKQIIEYKEALVFALLGVLRVRGEINVMKSVTRASADSCSGILAGFI